MRLWQRQGSVSLPGLFISAPCPGYFLFTLVYIANSLSCNVQQKVYAHRINDYANRL